MRFGLLFAGVLLLAVSGSARAQQSVTIEFHDGQVNLRAQNAPARAILAEWARRGGATIVNAERVAGPPLTLELTGIPERQALDIVLRSVAGYMLAPRRAGSAGASMFDRILILPTSTAPRPAPAAATPPPAFGAPRPLVPQPQVLRQPPRPVQVPPGAAADDQADDPADQDGPEAPVTRPAPPRMIRPAIPQAADREPPVVEEETDAPEPDNPPSVAPTPGNPFGVPAGSGRPGVITPVPQQQRPQGQQR